MALVSDSAMVLYYDITGDNADHDDWHTYEHMHERLSIPGFLRLDQLDVSESRLGENGAWRLESFAPLPGFIAALASHPG
jgi:hypothetical protein